VTKVIGLGAGGHAKVVIEILRLNGGYTLHGLLDKDPGLWYTDVFGLPVLGDDSMLPGLHRQGITHAFIGLGSTGEIGPRRRLYDLARENGFHPVAAIHPGAIVSASVEVGKGPTIMAGALINPDAKLGDNVIINTGAIVEHDCVIGDHVHVATGAQLASTVTVGAGAHVGIGASVRQSITIGEGAVVGAGAVVVKDVEPGLVVAGVPARALKPNQAGQRSAGRFTPANSS
jgi:UDP-perosamine 4-acetyltransferase